MNCLPDGAVIVNSWQMLRGDRSQIGVVMLISRRQLKCL